MRRASFWLGLQHQGLEAGSSLRRRKAQTKGPPWVTAALSLRRAIMGVKRPRCVLSHGSNDTLRRPLWLRPLAVIGAVSAHGAALAGLIVKAPVEMVGQPPPVDLVRDVEPASARAGADWSPASTLAAAVPAPDPPPPVEIRLPSLATAIPPPDPPPPIEIRLPTLAAALREPDSPPPLEFQLPKLEDAVPPPEVEVPATVLIPVLPPTQPAPKREPERVNPQPPPPQRQPPPRRTSPAERSAATAPAQAAPSSGANPASPESGKQAKSSASDVDLAAARYATQVHRLLQARANALGLEHVTGTVGLTFTIDDSGRIISHAITLASGDQHIDRAMKRLMTTTVFPPPPGGRFSGTVTIRIR